MYIIYVRNLYMSHCPQKNVKPHTSSLWCLLLWPHKLFLLWYIFPHVWHQYIFRPQQISWWHSQFLLKWNTVSHKSQCHSWKYVTCDEYDESQNVYKIMILVIIIIIIIIIIIKIIIRWKPSNKHLCHKNWYTNDIQFMLIYMMILQT